MTKKGLYINLHVGSYFFSSYFHLFVCILCDFIVRISMFSFERVPVCSRIQNNRFTLFNTHVVLVPQSYAGEPTDQIKADSDMFFFKLG